MSKNYCVGITTEYNPFHKGHKYQIDSIRERLGPVPIIAVMSGNFVQRGAPALADKWTRANWALISGVDLVIELPVSYSLRSGMYFAQGAVRTLAATGCVTHLAFGCEATQPEQLLGLSQLSCDDQLLRAHLSTGLSYAAALVLSIPGLTDAERQLLKEPNNILALEYLKALDKVRPAIQPLPLRRRGSSHHSTLLGEELSSGSAIRHALAASNAKSKLRSTVPPQVYTWLQRNISPEQLAQREERLINLLNYRLTHVSAPELQKYCDCSEGLDNKILSSAPASSYDELLESIKSKRYPRTRLARLLCQSLISSVACPFSATAKTRPQYLRVLGLSNVGRTLLKTMKTTAKLPVLTKIGRDVYLQHPAKSFRQLLQLDMLATDTYATLCGQAVSHQDYTTSPVYLERE